MTLPSPREARVAVRPAAYSPGRIVLTAVVIVAFMALGWIAGRWQWGRYETKSHALHAQHHAASQPTVPLESIMTVDDIGPGDAEWRTVTVAGAIDAADLVQLRGRSIDGTATIQYLAWLHDPAGHAVVVNLGWTPRAHPQPPRIPAGSVTVTGTVRSLEADNGRKGTRINPRHMGGIDGEVFQAYLMVDSACVATDCVTGIEPVPLPELSTGPHLSYAMQWWLLLVAAAPLGVWLTVRDARLERERRAPAEPPLLADGEESVSSVTSSPREAPRPHPKRVGPSDEEIEDAL